MNLGPRPAFAYLIHAYPGTLSLASCPDKQDARRAGVETLGVQDAATWLGPCDAVFVPADDANRRSPTFGVRNFIVREHGNQLCCSKPWSRGTHIESSMTQSRMVGSISNE